ncbi:MAG: heavy metal-binding domain-containing protein [Pirellulales bacterium]
MNSTPSTLRFWLRAVQVRLRFFLFIAGLTILFAAWPRLLILWERGTASFTASISEPSVSSGSEFFCPMDPGVISVWPAICPICNMDLIRRQKTDAQILPDGAVARMQFSPYKLTLAGIRTVPIESAETPSNLLPSQAPVATASNPNRIKVPASSVLYWNQQPLVYVESMPGMFDAIPVTLENRTGESQIVEAKLSAGQRVAAVGALLLDAESRLRPNISTQYFGASQPSSLATTPPELPKKQEPTKADPLSEPDRAIVALQKICPVTEAELGSMGTPIFVEVLGRRVALCCGSCRGRIQNDPEKYLQRIPSTSAPASSDKK